MLARARVSTGLFQEAVANMVSTAGQREGLHTMTARLLERKHVQPEHRPVRRSCVPALARALLAKMVYFA